MEVWGITLGVVGGLLGAMLEILGTILGIVELMLDENGFGNRKGGLSIGVCDALILGPSWANLGPSRAILGSS